jgi:gephyrin
VRLSHPLREDPHRTEFHRAVIRWVLDDGSGRPGYIAESTGHQASSRLLSMKSANALLEVPSTGQILAAGTSIQAILISDVVILRINHPLLQIHVHLILLHLQKVFPWMYLSLQLLKMLKLK